MLPKIAELIAPPDPLPRADVTLPWTKVADSAWNRGTLVMGFNDCVCKVSDDNGREIGYVSGVMAGYLEICINRDDGTFELWRLDPRDVWHIASTLLQSANAGKAQPANESGEEHERKDVIGPILGETYDDME